MRTKLLIFRLKCRNSLQEDGNSNQDLPEENYHRAIQKLDDVMLEMRNLHEPIDVEPIDDDPEDEQPSSKLNPQPQAPDPELLTSDPITQLADATDPLEVEIDLHSRGAGYKLRSHNMFRRRATSEPNWRVTGPLHSFIPQWRLTATPGQPTINAFS